MGWTARAWTGTPWTGTGSGGDGQSEKGAGGDGPRASFPGLRVLLAEDNLVHQKITLRVLHRLGVRADVASNGAEAVEAARAAAATAPYDVVLMDVHMPVMDGFEATASLRALPLVRQPYVVALTGSSVGAYVRSGRASGMDAFVSKPITADHLSAVLRAAVARQSASARAAAVPA